MGFRHKVRAADVAALFLLSGLNSGSLWAGTFHVVPLRVELSSQQTSAALTVQNNGDEPAAIQLNTMAWSQESGQEQYLASEDLLATPQTFTIQPGAEQVVRIGMRTFAGVDQERSYRLFLQEVPAPPKPGSRTLQAALRIGIPIFIEPKIKVAPVLNWKVERPARNQFKISLKNDGNTHIQVMDFRVSQPDREQSLAVQPVSSYLLSGQSHDWVLRTEPGQSFSGDKVHLTIYTDAGKMETDVMVEKP